MICAFDGNFGLVRKQTAGVSYEAAKHGDHLFLDDDDVAAFLSNYSSDGKADDSVSLVIEVFTQARSLEQ